MVKINSDIFIKNEMLKSLKEPQSIEHSSSSIFSKSGKVISESQNVSQTVDTDENDKKLSELISGNYDVLSSIDWKTSEGTQQFLDISEKFISVTGKSLYDEMISRYEAGKISKDNLQKNLKILLDMSEFTPNNQDSDDVWTSYYDFLDLKDIVLSDNFNIEDLKNIDYNNYFNKVTRPYAENARKAKLLSSYDVTKSQIAPLLPKITNIKTGDNTIIQKFNDKEYQINYSDDAINVRDGNKQYVIEFKNLLSQINDENDKNSVKKMIEGLSAPVLIDLAVEIDTIKVCNDPDSATYAQYDGKDNVITINLAKKDEKNAVFALAHEIGHSLDFSKHEDRNMVTFGFNQQFLEIARNEMKKLAGKEDYEKQYATTNPVEMFAECYTLLNMGSSADSNYVLATYFPKTVEYVKKQIETQRNLPENERNFIGRDTSLLERIRDNPSW